MKVKLTATIPVVQYGNIIPEIEGEGKTYEEALSQAEHRLVEIWNKYVEPGKGLTSEAPTNNREKLTDLFGNEIFYDKANHIYTNEAGEVYLSGSRYAESFKKPFDKENIAAKMAKKAGVNPEDIIKMWELKGQASRDLGSAIHAALELEEKYRALGESLGKSGEHDHPILKQAVDSFKMAHKGEKALNEVLVVDHKSKRAGQIDRLLITGDKRCRIQDFKTGTTVKDLEFYWKQLDFYGTIFIANGWQVEGLDVFHYDGQWHDYNQEILSSLTPGTENIAKADIAKADMARAKALKETKK